MFDAVPWTRFLPLLLWITGIVGAWIALLISVIKALLHRSVTQIDHQFADLRLRLDALEASLGGTNQKVTSLELKLQHEIASLREEIQGGYLRKDEWIRNEHHREEAARRVSARLEALEQAGRAVPAPAAPLPAVLPAFPWPVPYPPVFPAPGSGGATSAASPSDLPPPSQNPQAGPTAA